MPPLSQQVTGGQLFYVLDWDNQWWQLAGDRWKRVKVRRNLLLQPIPESVSVPELAETKGEMTP